MFNDGYLSTLRLLWKHPSASRGEILAFQNQRLRALMRHAYENVAYYRKHFDRAGLRPDSVRSIDDLGAVPFTSKNDLRRCPTEETVARGVNPDRLITRATSGSSGRPFTVRLRHREEYLLTMFRIRARRQHGSRLRDNRALVLLGPVPGEKGRDSLLIQLCQTLGIYRYDLVKCLQPAEEICRQLEELDPDSIHGYPSVLAQVAHLARGRFIDKKLRYISCGGESLSGPKRRAIEDGFGVRVYDIYGTHECNIIAWECVETGRYHVCDDNVIVEILKDGRPVAEGESGEVVLTCLHSYGMPFIRYRMGDIVVKGPETCTCGQPFSTLLSIKGRVREYFSLPDGRRVHPLEIILPVFTQKAPWLDQFQMIQETDSTFILRVSALQVPGPGDLDRLKTAIGDRLGPGAGLRMELVDKIPFEPSGKFRDCVCRI